MYVYILMYFNGIRENFKEISNPFPQLPPVYN